MNFQHAKKKKSFLYFCIVIISLLSWACNNTNNKDQDISQNKIVTWDIEIKSDDNLNDTELTLIEKIIERVAELEENIANLKKAIVDLKKSVSNVKEDSLAYHTDYRKVKYEIFRDLLLVFIASATLIIGILGYLVYRVVGINIEKKVYELHLQSTARSFTAVGLCSWQYYVIERNIMKKEIFLRQALMLTDSAYQKYALGLDRRNKQNDELVCVIMNNLAYYLAESCRLKIKVLGRDVKENSKLAHALVNEIIKKITIYPLHAKEWIDTLGFVEKHCIYK